MGRSVGELVIDLRGDITSLRADVSKGLDGVDARLQKTETAVVGLTDKLGGLAGGFNLVRNAVVGLGAAALANDFAQAADSMKLADARLKLVTTSANEYAQAQADIIKLADDNRTGLNETYKLYTKLGEPIQRLGGSTREITAVTEGFTKALKLGGPAAEEASSAILQFGQAMGSGKLAGDEFKSISEASPRLMRAIAEGANLPIEQLKKLGSEGKLTADVISKALLNQLPKLREEFDSLPRTSAEGLQAIKNEFLLISKEIEQQTGLTGGLASAMFGFAKVAHDNIEPIGAAVGAATQFLKDHGETIVKVGALYAGFKATAIMRDFALAQGAALAGAAESAIAARAAAAADAEMTAAVAAAATSKLASAQASNTLALAERERVASTLAAIQADIAVEQVRLKAQITDAGRAARTQQLAGLSLELAGAQRLLTTSEATLLASSQAVTIAQAEQAAATTALAGAQRAASVAGAAATGAMGVARGMLLALGGPIGAIITLLGVGFTAWQLFGSASESNAGRAVDATGDVIAETDKLIAKLRERNQLQGQSQEVSGQVGKLQGELQAISGQYEDLAKKRDAAANTAQWHSYNQALNLVHNRYIALSEKIGELQRAEQSAYEVKDQFVNLKAKEVGVDAKKSQGAANELADLRGRIDAEKQLTNDLLSQSDSKTKLTEGEKLAAKVRQELAVATTATARAQLQAKLVLAESLGAVQRHNEGVKDQIALNEKAAKFQQKLNEWISDTSDQDAIRADIKLIGLSNEERERAAAIAKIEAEARDKINEAIRDGLPNQEAMVEQITLETESREANTIALLKQKQAGQLLYDLQQENAKLADSLILGDEARREAGLAREAAAWRKRIELYQEGTEERKRLEEEFAKWQANKTAEPMVEGIRKASERIGGTFRDSFREMLVAGKSDWDSFEDSIVASWKVEVADQLIDALKRAFAEPIMANVIANVTGVGGSGGGAAGGGGNILGMLKDVSSMFNTGGGGMMSSIGGMIGSGVSSIGSMIGSSSMTGFGAGMQFGTFGANSMAALADAGLTSAATASGASAGAGFMSGIGAAMPYAAIALAIAKIGNYFMHSEWNRSGGGVKGAVSGIWNRIFGHSKTNADAAGVQGALTAEGFAGTEWQDYSQKGGAFRKDKRWTDTTEVRSEFQSTLDAAIKTAVSSVKTLGGALGVEAENALKGWSYNFNLQLTENGDWSKAGEKMGEEIGRATDSLASRLIPNIADFAQQGETAGVTLARISSEFGATNLILEAMGRDGAAAFGAVGLASVKAREDLISLAGGLEQFSAKTDFFYQNFYSERERTEKAAETASKVLAEGFEAIGLAVPETRAQYRALVEEASAAGKLATEEGRKRLASLLDLAPAMDAVSDAEEQLAASSNAVTDAVKQASDAQMQAAQKSIAAMQAIVQQIDQLGSLRSSIADSSYSIKSKMAGFDAVGYWGNQVDSLKEKLAGATSTGDRVNVGGQLRDAIMAKYQAERELIDKNRQAQQAAFDQQRSAAESVFSAQQEAMQNQAQAVSAWNSALRNIGDYAKSLLLGDLSTLGNEEKLRQAQAQYDALLAKTRSGDAEAAGQLSGAASAYLGAAREWFGSTEGYASIFGAVQGAMAGLGAQAQDPAVIQAQTAQQSFALQQQQFVFDQTWSAKDAELQAQWQQEDAQLSQQYLDQLQGLDDTVKSWQDVLNDKLAETALLESKSNEYLGSIAANTEGLDQRIAAAISAAVATQMAVANAAVADALNRNVQLTEQLVEVTAAAASSQVEIGQAQIEQLGNMGTLNALGLARK